VISVYKVENAEVEQAIRSLNPLYGLILERISTGEKYAGEYLFSAETETASTTLSDDIELGAICSQSLSVRLTGAKKYIIFRAAIQTVYLPKKPFRDNL